MPTEKTRVVTGRIPSLLAADLDRMAEASGQTRAAIIEQALMVYLAIMNRGWTAGPNPHLQRQAGAFAKVLQASLTASSGPVTQPSPNP